MVGLAVEVIILDPGDRTDPPFRAEVPGCVRTKASRFGLFGALLMWAGAFSIVIFANALIAYLFRNRSEVSEGSADSLRMFRLSLHLCVCGDARDM